MVALDGERRLPSRDGLVRVVDGPLVIDLEEALRVFGPFSGDRSRG
jgi:hypothetical protein